MRNSAGAIVRCIVMVTTMVVVTSACDHPATRSVPATASTAFADYGSTTFGRRFDALEQQHPGQSGFSIIRLGRAALTARIAMADLAERSLDVQYYIWEDDAAGRILADRLVRAADRGVRVRVLVDDMNVAGRDALIAALDAHPNIEIRLFNPFAHRRYRGLDFLTDLERVNHRMHNKLMVMDNAIAIVGGRNIGGHYFEADTRSNFRDLDIATAGPIVRQASAVFDRFWNGEWAIPIASLSTEPAQMIDYRSAIASLRAKMQLDPYPFPLDVDLDELMKRLDAVLTGLIWAKGEILWDDPASIHEGRRSGVMNEALYKRLEAVQHELLIESAYFVARDRGVDAARQLTRRGVRIRVLTNSLASNDVLAAHAGYARYRKPLLEAGVELYELRPYPGPIGKTGVPGMSKAGLHTKAIVFDRKDVFVGSFNLDPRSASINTEAGVYVQSSELAQQVVQYMAEGVSAEDAYHVILDDQDELQWVIDLNGDRVTFDHDPDSTWRQRMTVGAIQLLPIEGHL